MTASTITAPHDTHGHGDEPTYDLVPVGIEAPPRRPRVLLIGTALAGAALIMLFAGLLGMYLHARHAVITGPAVDGQAPVWFADGNPVPLTPANIALGTMVLSCITMAWAVYAVKNNDRHSAYFALALTILFGAAVINATTFLYSETGLPIASETTPAGLLFYAVTGTHLALIVGALIFATIMTFRTLGGEYGGRDSDGIVAASFIWYLTAAIFGVIWYAVYVTK
jgi:heme/copper-type cytochrome/quinol oxidase subunit 3